jgi:hypothetical protein
MFRIQITSKTSHWFFTNNFNSASIDVIMYIPFFWKMPGGCAGLGSVYFNRRQRTRLRKLQAEGQVGSIRGLGEFIV